jgi:uncharacterized protein YndB with AHSA1/START domain
MRQFSGSATAFIDSPPEAIFDVITDVERLPEWNAAVESVVSAPPLLRAGSEWVVVMHPKGMPKWNSRSAAVEINRDALRFVYRSMSDDGNPSFVRWSWQIAAADGGAQVVVSWEAHPETFWRRMLFAPYLRRPQLNKEVPLSLQVLDHLVSRRSIR